jgi:putative ABC transport system permease protein
LRIIGVLKATGQGVGGMNTDEVVFVPVSVAQSLFNTSTLFRVLIEARSRDEIEAAKREVTAVLKARHSEEDITVITQDAVLATFDKLLRALTAAVAGIAAISLAVAGILVMNVMLVAVTQRTAEIGLLKALGARAATIRNAFMAEAAMLSLVGAVTGYGLGLFGAFVLRQMYPVFPAYPPDWAVVAALGTALGTGMLFGIMPARRAARLDPVQALMKH